MKRLFLILAMLLFACTSIPVEAADPAPPIKRQTEVWGIVWQADTANKREYLMYAKAQLRALFRGYKIRFEIPNPLAPERYARIIWVRNWINAPVPLGSYIFGIADGIDKGNKIHQHKVLVSLGAILRNLKENKEQPKPLTVGVDLGTLIAHEVGHTLGLRHKRIEVRADLSCIMTQGAHAFSPSYRYSQKWSFNNQILLSHLLGKKTPRLSKPVPAKTG